MLLPAIERRASAYYQHRVPKLCCDRSNSMPRAHKAPRDPNQTEEKGGKGDAPCREPGKIHRAASLLPTPAAQYPSAKLHHPGNHRHAGTCEDEPARAEHESARYFEVEVQAQRHHGEAPPHWQKTVPPAVPPTPRGRESTGGLRGSEVGTSCVPSAAAARPLGARRCLLLQLLLLALRLQHCSGLRWSMNNTRIAPVQLQQHLAGRI